MSPSLSINNLPDGFLADSKRLGEHWLRYQSGRISLSDFSNIGRSKLAVAVLLSARESVGVGSTIMKITLGWSWISQHVNRMLNISRAGDVFQILNAIIAWLAVLVIDLVEWRPGADKSCCDQRMNRMALSTSGIKQANASVAFSIGLRSEEIRNSPETPKVRDLVNRLISYYWPPFFSCLRHGTNNAAITL